MSDKMPVVFGVFFDEKTTAMVVEMANAQGEYTVPGDTLQKRCQLTVLNCIHTVYEVMKREGLL